MIKFGRLLTKLLLAGLAGWLALLSAFQGVLAADPVVRAVLFYSPTCGHCHAVITETLTPMIEQYAGKLEIVGIDISVEQGAALYQDTIQAFQIPEDRLGVPTLIIGETVLVGALEIPEQFPGMVEAGLAAGGIDWPQVPGLAELMAAEPAPEESAAGADATGIAPLARALDRTGGKLALNLRKAGKRSLLVAADKLDKMKERAQEKLARLSREGTPRTGRQASLLEKE